MTALSPGATDEHLVVAAQGGNPEAFAALFQRYRPEIARYAGRVLGDDSRAEDVVQETFLSALRSIGTLDRPEGFKPWLYRIAHNASVDQMRRRGRGEEVLIDAQVLPPAEEIRLFKQAPSSHATLAQKEAFQHLRQALMDLPEAQAQILVLRELEGLTYEEIATHMGISHSAVESMLFRARRAMRAEYGEISTGERCRKMRAVMAQVVEGVGGRRDRLALVRHVHGCAGCRRDAFLIGLGPLVDIDGRGAVRRGLSKVAALLPLPGFLNKRSEETGQLTISSSNGMSFAAHAQSAITHMSVSAGTTVEHAATAIQKAAAVVAAAAVVTGGGFVANETRTHPAPPPAVAKHFKDTRAPGFAPARPGAVFTSPLPLSLAPLAVGPPAATLGPETDSSAAPATAGDPPAESPPESQAPAAAELPAVENTEAAVIETFDIPTSAPDPPAEAVADPPADPPAADPPADPAPPVDPAPPADPPAEDPVGPPISGGSPDPGPDQPPADSGGSGSVN